MKGLTVCREVLEGVLEKFKRGLGKKGDVFEEGLISQLHTMVSL